MTDLRLIFRITLFILPFFSLSCIGSRTFVYPEPILLDREPEVSVQFTSTNLTIVVPVETRNASPSAYRLTLLQRNRPAEPLLEKIFFPDEPIKVVLPITIFSEEELGNMAVLAPLGGDFTPQNQFFTLPPGTELQLHPFLVEPPSDVLRITVLEDATGLPVEKALVAVIDASQILVQGETDSLGYSRLEVKAPKATSGKYKVMISTEGQFPPWSGMITVGEGHQGAETIRLQHLSLDTEGSHPYRVVDNLVPFKKGPENGAPVLFFLSAGDRIQVSKVSGDRVFGSLAVQTPGGQGIQTFQGWVLKKYLEFVP